VGFDFLVLMLPNLSKVVYSLLFQIKMYMKIRFKETEFLEENWCLSLWYLTVKFHSIGNSVEGTKTYSCVLEELLRIQSQKKKKILLDLVTQR
jgi:hypothetical protein